MFQVNGKLTNKINIKDRAVQYGDGVFETIAVKKNSVEFWKEHYRRLSQGCRVLKIKCPSELFLRKEITNFLKKIKKKKFVLKLIISRGEGLLYIIIPITPPDISYYKSIYHTHHY